jgi:methylated-DNA-[protein]-cysteine S-methyltransferase
MGSLSLHSPVGDLTLFDEDGALVALEWGWGSVQEPTPLLEKTKAFLHNYFDGQAADVMTLPMEPPGTPFQRRVWQTLCEIPYGKTVTYGEIAARLGSHARAIGTAVGANPIPILIPCHRVVGGDGALIGYSGEGGVQTKAFLLRLEGAAVTAQRQLPL